MLHFFWGHFISKGHYSMDGDVNQGHSLISGSGVVHTKRSPLLSRTFTPSRTYRRLEIHADRCNLGVLFVDTGIEDDCVKLAAGEETALEVPCVTSVYVLGSADNTAYKWSAE
jgi:hypothetical protein